MPPAVPIPPKSRRMPSARRATMTPTLLPKGQWYSDCPGESNVLAPGAAEPLPSVWWDCLCRMPPSKSGMPFRGEGFACRGSFWLFLGSLRGRVPRAGFIKPEMPSRIPGSPCRHDISPAFGGASLSRRIAGAKRHARHPSSCDLPGSLGEHLQPGTVWALEPWHHSAGSTICPVMLHAWHGCFGVQANHPA